VSGSNVTTRHGLWDRDSATPAANAADQVMIGPLKVWAVP
jgi:hypothetical protein